MDLVGLFGRKVLQSVVEGLGDFKRVIPPTFIPEIDRLLRKCGQRMNTAYQDTKISIRNVLGADEDDSLQIPFELEKIKDLLNEN